ncbi:hypothetical protein [Streptomyces sp. CS057]|uniref:hypothetical protein n=1 Tax=Streptomyces sp. CS057 TaxID=1982764 RepID=UPI000B423033|nr:hypothetical protein [Streptomyces sp. CS057]OWA23489.1 hypothetical protein B9W61_16775 [Streptomyces sp. CS057]
MLLTVVRHAESIENATKHTSFYQDPRPWGSAQGLDDGAQVVVAMTHHTAILALRSVLERRPVTELVDEARDRKTPNVGVLVYERRGHRFDRVGTAEPDY